MLCYNFFALKNTYESGEEMGNLTLYREESGAFTAVSNCFIDEYMSEANDAQLKVYLYLLRCLQVNRPTGVSEMADLFNHTEKDILRALKYWEKKGLLSLDYDSTKTLSAIRLLSPTGSQNPQPAQSADIVPLPAPKHTQETSAPVSAIQKPSYSLDDLKAFRSGEETEQLLFIVEQYIGKPLTPSEMKTVLFLYDKLGFSADLIDYLVQYCVERDKRSFRFIETVALNWAQNGITTQAQAKDFVKFYDKTIYTIMKALGKSGAPAPSEAAYINRWTKEFGFSLSVIETACERTVLATDKNRFQYADSILTSWHRLGVQSKEDVQKADLTYQKSKTPHAATRSNTTNAFNQFPQREYDFDALEKELLSN